MADFWTMRPYRLGDEESIIELFRTVFNVETTLVKWTWRYIENGINLKLIMLAESAAGDIIGQYALCPIRMKVDGKEIIGSFSLDTMVHPDWGGRGIFVDLANAVYDAAVGSGIPLTYGFPNVNSHHGFINKLGWMDLCKALPILVKPISIRSLIRSRFENERSARFVDLLARAGYWLYTSGSIREPSAGNYCVRRVEYFGREAGLLWERSSGIARVSVIRDAAYLNWRFARNPTEEYCILYAEQGGELSGYAVLKLSDDFGIRVGYVVDLLALPEDEKIVYALMEDALGYFVENDMDIAGCLMMRNLPYEKQLRKLGFLRVPTRLFPQEIYLGVRNNTGEFTNGLLGDWRNWNISWADHDRV
jgi:GNAT superfamily N-acetyltransferase